LIADDESYEGYTLLEAKEKIQRDPENVKAIFRLC